MKRGVNTAALLVILLCGCAAAQNADYGDAPEGAVAYPHLDPPVMGNFPTCAGVGDSGTHVEHTVGCGPHFPGELSGTCDTELDGAGCPGFAAYNTDECYGDDAGLIRPIAFTIEGDAITPCPGAPGDTIPRMTECNYVRIGIDFDINLSNDRPDWAYVNILADWNQDGEWGGSVLCGSGAVLEHCLINRAIAPYVVMSLGDYTQPSFFAGPGSDYYWFRISITDAPIPHPWDGSGTFGAGETEDYLLKVGPLTPVERASWGTMKAMYR